MSRSDFLRRRCDMRIERARHEVAKAQRQGELLTTTDILALVEDAFTAGGAAMADAIQIELSELRLAEMDERETFATAGKLVAL